MPFDAALAVLNCPDSELDGLYETVFTRRSLRDGLYEVVSRLRRAHRGATDSIQVITGVKNGDCEEDCHYCAQSRDSLASVAKYRLLSEEFLLQKARLGAKGRVTRHCLAFSGLRFSDAEIKTFCRQISLAKKEANTPICCSIGLLTRAQAMTLKEAGVSRINHDLNSSARFYPGICSTHSYEERLENLLTVKSAGLELCRGGIVGLGEEKADVADLFMAIRGLEPASVPVNFYVPVEGTALADRNPGPLSPEHCLKVLALARPLRSQKPRSGARRGGKGICRGRPITFWRPPTQFSPAVT